MWIAAVLLVAVTGSCDVPSSEAVFEAALPYETFDSYAAPYGWRPLLTAGCTDSAVNLLAAYSSANQETLTLAQRLELQFHIGQALAMSGRERESIQYFERATDPGATEEWRTYVEATLAFLRHDPGELAAALRTYAAIEPDSMRLKIIDGMAACPSEPYAEAIHCRM